MFDRTDRSHIGVWWWTVDKMMLTSIFLLMVLGAVLVMAASPPVADRIGLPELHFVWKQLIFFMPATAIMLITSILSARLIRILCLLSLILISGLMIATVLIGPEVKGATRWLTIAGFRMQPSEFIKPLCAISCAWLLGLWRDREQFPGWIWASAISGFVITLLMLQPDIGMTSVVLLTFGFQLFLAGLPLLLVFTAIGFTPLAGWLAYSHFGHVQQRVDKFLDGGGMQTERSIQSFAEGGWFGVGPGNGTVKQYLPDAHADFIFSVSRTIEDKQNNQGKIFIAKNRNGPDGMVYPIFMDTSNVNIKILPRAPAVNTQGQTQVVTAPVALDPAAQKKLLADKYTKLRGKRK